MTTVTGQGSSGSAAGGKSELFARLGYVAKGVVYAAVGVLTLGAVFDWFAAAKVTGTRGAVEAIATQPFGNALLILMVLGLAGYVFWRFVQAIRDTEGKGSDASGLLQRAGFAISGFTYATLALYTLSLTNWFGGGGQGDSTKQEITARIMSHEIGIWLIGAIGIVLIGLGFYQLYRSISKKFTDNWKTGELTHGEQSLAVRFAQFGIAARAVTFWAIGGIIVKAAVTANPDEARGLGHALRSLQDADFGSPLLIAISAGLVCYGLYCFVNARYRTVDA